MIIFVRKTIKTDGYPAYDEEWAAFRDNMECLKETQIERWIERETTNFEISKNDDPRLAVSTVEFDQFFADELEDLSVGDLMNMPAKMFKLALSQMEGRM